MAYGPSLRFKTIKAFRIKFLNRNRSFYGAPFISNFSEIIVIAPYRVNGIVFIFKHSSAAGSF